MRWRAFVVLVCALVLVLGVVATPGAASDAKSALWWDWMASSWIGFDGPGDPTPESWDLPSIQGDWVVWQKTADAALNWNVEAYNIRTREIKGVSYAVGNQLFPAVYGNWVVYMDLRNPGNYEIYAKNLSTGEERRLTNTPTIQEFMPDISGTKVVFFSTVGDVWVHDLATNATTQLPLGGGAQIFARISGDRVVYQESNDIFAYDLRTGSITRLTSDIVADAFPDIDGTLVAWQRQGAQLEVWTKELTGGSASRLINIAGAESAPRVSDGHVLFAHDDGTEPFELGLCDKSTGGYVLLTDDGDNMNPGLQFAAIDGANVVYTDEWGAGTYGGYIALGRLTATAFRAGTSATNPSYGGKVTLSGSLADAGIPLGKVPLKVQRSTNGGYSWADVGSPNTNSAGDFSFVTQANYSSTLYRLRYAGALFFGPTYPDHLSVTSAPLKVVPRASVGTPAGYPKNAKKNKTYTVYGSLKQRQVAAPASAKVVVIKCYRKVSGKYRLKKTVNARVYNYSTYSRYKANVKLTTAGKWRIRAYFKGSSINAEKTGAYKSVTVK